MADTLRIGLIGCGRILDAHLNGYKALWDHGWRDFRLVALCARREKDALRYRRRDEGPEPRPPIFGLQGDPMVAPHVYVSDIHDDLDAAVCTDYRAMLADPALALDAVVVCTPVHNHHEIALAALEAGLHVLVEKPLAISVAAGRRLVEAARRHELQLAVAESARFRDLARMAKWAIDRGEVGEVQLAVQAGLGTVWSPDRVRADTPWRHDKLLAGGGIAIDRGVHLFHLLEYLCGEIETVAALTRVLEPKRRRLDAAGEVVEEVDCDVDDTFLAHCRFRSGAVGQLSYSAALHGEPSTLPSTIYGTKGSLRAGRVLRDDGSESWLPALFGRYAGEEERQRLLPRTMHDAFALETHVWLESIRTGRPSEIDGEVGLRDLALAFAALESGAAEGAPVRVAEVLSGAVSGYQAAIDRHYGLR